MLLKFLGIDQSNSSERSHQVGLMGHIYAKASQVVIWLGPRQSKCDLNLSRISKTSEDRAHIGRILHALELILQRDWFGRVWVAQELALAQHDPTVLCGLEKTRWSRFAAMVGFLRSAILEWESWFRRIDHLINGHEDISDSHSPVIDVSQFPESKRKISNMILQLYDIKKHGGVDLDGIRMKPEFETLRAVSSLALRVENLAMIRQAGRRATLSEQLRNTIYMRATDPRDRIFAILGLSNYTSHILTADYTQATSHIAAQLARHLIQEDLSGYLRCRLWEYRRYHTSQADFVPQTPSWAPELDVLGQRSLKESDAPILEKIDHALSHIDQPTVHSTFSNDLRIMYAMGYNMGEAIPESTSFDLRSQFSTYFSTHSGYHGHLGHKANLRAGKNYLVGLFGINVPFLLQVMPSSSDVTAYKILGYGILDSSAATVDESNTGTINTNSEEEWAPFSIVDPEYLQMYNIV